MAKKQPSSILNRLRKLVEPTPEKPKTSKETVKPSERHSPASSADPAMASASAAEPPERDKKKALNQPWYRHRQRW
jgi:hypothetical protein